MGSLGAAVPAADYIASVNWVHAWSRRMHAWWDDFDVLVSPVIAVPPPPIGWLSDPELGTERLTSILQFTAQFNTSGQPAMSLPLHWSPDGPPGGACSSSDRSTTRRCCCGLAGPARNSGPLGRPDPVAVRLRENGQPADTVMTLRVLSWNLWWRFGDWERRRHAIVDTIRGADPRRAVSAGGVGRNERRRRHGRDPQPRTGLLRSSSTTSIGRSEIGFTNAVLSRWPNRLLHDEALPRADGSPGHRRIVAATVATPWGRGRSRRRTSITVRRLRSPAGAMLAMLELAAGGGVIRPLSSR